MTVDAVIDVARLVFVVSGFAAIVRGAFLAYQPLGWAVAGLILVAVGLIGAVRRQPKG